MNELTAYAYDLVSYLALQPFFNKQPINQIILFGSSARQDYNKKSDIDIFIDTLNISNNLKSQIEKAKDNFLNSDRAKKWASLNIKNEFSIIVGKLEDRKWSDLGRSMHSHAIILWKRYQETSNEGAEPFALVKWSVGAKETNKRINLARKLYGYSQKGKRYKGIFEALGINPIGDGIAIIPINYTNQFRKLLNELGVKYILKDIFVKK